MLSPAEIRRIARLARIEVDDAQVAGLGPELNAILEMVERMQGADVAGVEPMSHPQAFAQRLREDVVTEGDRRVAYQSVAPQVEDGLYLVPRVID
ncbi:MAG TPA: Asp-tRNA(Asn)/Glu-tRNA(Gln) amidotransferase subunit GatC [Usitatibacter sp.]|jgi:aspartyl-tRNA(Asn)/glutamyl-tRNA(Gln) amidotransferase subunit C|nr:Asp-tRNA(Asn)/Glu-tRNA(Gln) amidotransferase subunit GatC [Usitatibacter sp.]